MHSLRAPALVLLLVLCSLSMMADPIDRVQQFTEQNEFDNLTPDQRHALDNLSPEPHRCVILKNCRAWSAGANAAWGWVVKAETDSDLGTKIAVDSSGNAYVTGNFKATATFGNLTLTSSGGSDIFISKISATGEWQWVVSAGEQTGDDEQGRVRESGRGIAVDPSGNTYSYHIMC